MWSINFFPKEKVPDFLRTKLKWVGLGSGLGLGLELVSKLVSEVVFWAFFEISLLITLEPHVGHTKFPDFYTFFLDNNAFVRYPANSQQQWSGMWQVTERGLLLSILQVRRTLLLILRTSAVPSILCYWLTTV